MRRRINHTGRKRIKQADISLSITSDSNGVDRFFADIALDKYSFPESARVWLEAYDRNAIMRFPFGSVEKPHAETATSLSAFAGSESYYFRVKIVDQETKGRLYGVADAISPVRQDAEDDSRKSLLRVTTEDLGPVPWKLDFPSGDYPILIINNKIDAGKSLARSNMFFQAAVFPSIVHMILRKILVEDGYRPSSEAEPEDAWKEGWVEFCAGLPGNTSLPIDGDSSEDEIDNWIDDSVDAFCRMLNPVRKLRVELREVDL